MQALNSTFGVAASTFSKIKNPNMCYATAVEIKCKYLPLHIKQYHSQSNKFMFYAVKFIVLTEFVLEYNDAKYTALDRQSK